MRSMNLDATAPRHVLPRATGPAPIRAFLRVEPADFRVDERVDVPAHPTGAHWWLQIRKTSLNTKDVVQTLAALGSARVRQVGYAGLKDRHAITTQWFSLPLEAIDPHSIADQLPAGMELLDVVRARHAVRRGGLRANRFVLRLREVERNDEAGEMQDATQDALRNAVQRRLERIRQGVPNYFGEQRFGRGGGNLTRARRLFDGSLERVPRFERGLYLSAARAWLFNQVLAERVRADSWNRLLPGEAVVLDGSRSWFRLEDEPETLLERLERFDIHPSGPLHGLGDPAVDGACAELEARVLARDPDLVTGLENWRLRAERRPLRLVPANLAYCWEGSDLLIDFELPSGAFATTVLHELATLNERP